MINGHEERLIVKHLERLLKVLGQPVGTQRPFLVPYVSIDNILLSPFLFVVIMGVLARLIQSNGFAVC